jgi:hypothetical protein
MKRAFVGLVLALCGTGYASTTLTYEYALDADGVLTTPYSSAIVDNFTTHPSGWTWTGGAIVTGSSPAQYAAPFNSAAMSAADTTPYETVPVPGTVSGSAVVDFGGSKYNYFGLFWGSIDTFNTLEFLNDGSVVAQYAGSDVTAPTSSEYVNFWGLPMFDSVRFSSTSPAFEFDNVAVGSIPAPGAMALGSLGIAVIGWLRSRKRL